MISVVAGIRVALLVRRKRRPSQSPRDQRVVGFLFVAILAVSSIVTLAVLKESLAVGSMFHVASIRQNWFRENQAFQLIFSMVLPAFFLFVSRQTRWSIILAAAAATFSILVLNGGRGTLMMIIIACALRPLHNLPKNVTGPKASRIGVLVCYTPKKEQYKRLLLMKSVDKQLRICHILYQLKRSEGREGYGI